MADRAPRLRAIWLTGILSLAALAAAAPVATAGPATGPLAQAAHTCHAPRYPGVGYFTSLHVSGTSCSRGGQVAIAYYHCRTRSGKAGRCSGGVLGYRCSETRNSIPTEIDARVTCRRGHAIVVHTYQQDL